MTPNGSMRRTNRYRIAGRINVLAITLIGSAFHQDDGGSPQPLLAQLIRQRVQPIRPGTGDLYSTSRCGAWQHKRPDTPRAGRPIRTQHLLLCNVLDTLDVSGCMFERQPGARGNYIRKGDLEIHEHNQSDRPIQAVVEQHW
jgi:hypothetical protein